MATSFNDLSHEVVDLIFKSLSRKSLTSVSLVCRAWHSISLPLLYHSISLKDEERTNSFVQRVLQEPSVADGVGERSNQGRGEEREGKVDEHYGANDRISFHLASYVRRIFVGLLPEEEEQQANLVKALLKLRNLDRLHLDLDTRWMEKSGSVWHDGLVLLHEGLPKLHTLSLVLTGDEFPLGNSDKVVALHNLRELVIKFDGSLDYEGDDPEWDTEVPGVVVDLIRGASNIESLSLTFQEDDEAPRPKWVPSALFRNSALSAAQFPNLRTFRSYARELVPVDFYDDNSTFRRFLRSHPFLHTVELDLSAYDGGPTLHDPPQIRMAPEEIVGLMPSVQQFEGPCVLVEALLKSNLAGQLQTLCVTQAHPEMLGDFKDLLPVIGDLGTPLPQLKKLEIRSDTVTCDSILIGFSNLAQGMPQLEEWIIDGEVPTIRQNRHVVEAPVDWVRFLIIAYMNQTLTLRSMYLFCKDVEKCLETLKHLPRLRILALSQVPGFRPENSTEIEDKNFLLRAGAVCPRLKTVYYAEMEEIYEQWGIVRQQGLPVDVANLRSHLSAAPFG